MSAQPPFDPNQPQQQPPQAPPPQQADPNKAGWPGGPDQPYDATMDTAIAPVELTQEELDEQASERARKADARRSVLDSIGMTLERNKETAISYRLEFEQMWMEDQAQYDDGEVMSVGGTGTKAVPGTSEPDYRKTKDNITRPAVLMVTARTADMLFPTTDRNWDLTPSPDAELPDDLVLPAVQARIDAGAADTYDLRQSIEQELAKERGNRMRQRIDDQLQEANYAAHGRDCIADAVFYGSGVIKGPFAKKRMARIYDPTTQRWERKWRDAPAPAVTYVDLFKFYPMPCRRIEEAEGAFELHLLTKERVRALADQPGFDREQIARVLREENISYGGLSRSILFQRGIGSRNGSVSTLLDNRYAIWEYHGSMPKEGIIAFVSGLAEMGKVTAEQAAEIVGEVSDDPMAEVQCECWMTAGIVIKLALEPVRETTNIYQVYNYEERPDTLFGNSVPRVIREDQLAATQLWQAMMLNAMMSAGLQIGVRKGALEPMGGEGGKSYDLTCSRPRVWAFTEEAEDIQKVFQVFNTPSVMDKLMPLYERAKNNAQEHIVLPAIVQGDPTNAVETSSGLAMLMNAGNIVSRRLAKGYDDNVTAPLITGFYEWNMDHGPDDIKGDYAIIPRGASHLLVKDVQSQRFLFAMTTYSNIEPLQARMKWDEWGRQGLTVMDMDANALMKTEKEFEVDEKKKAEAGPPPDPMLIRAQAALKEAETRQMIAQADAALSDEQIALKREEIESKERNVMLETASKERIAQLNYAAALAGLDEKSRAHIESIDAENQREGLRMRLKAAEMVTKQRSDQFEAQVEADTAPGPRLA